MEDVIGSSEATRQSLGIAAGLRFSQFSRAVPTMMNESPYL